MVTAEVVTVSDELRYSVGPRAVALSLRITGYAIPIRDGSGEMAAAIRTSVLTKRATKAHERKMLAAARLCVDQVERHMGNLDSGHADKAAKAG